MKMDCVPITTFRNGFTEEEKKQKNERQRKGVMDREREKKKSKLPTTQWTYR